MILRAPNPSCSSSSFSTLSGRRITLRTSRICQGIPFTDTLFCELIPVTTPFCQWNVQRAWASFTQTFSPSLTDETSLSPTLGGTAAECLQSYRKTDFCGTDSSYCPDLGDMLYQKTASTGLIRSLSAIAFIVRCCPSIFPLPPCRYAALKSRLTFHLLRSLASDSDRKTIALSISSSSTGPLSKNKLFTIETMQSAVSLLSSFQMANLPGPQSMIVRYATCL